MVDENGVEIVSNAPADGVKNGGDAPAIEPLKEVDNGLVKQLQDLLEENERVAAERDHYKEGMLKAKGKIVEDNGDEPAKGEDIAKLVEDAVERKLQANARNEQKDKLIRELKVALANRSQVATVTAGGSSDKPAVENGVLSSAQIADLKKRNPRFWTDENIKKYGSNIAKPRT